MPAFVVLPWARRGKVVHTRYDHDSVLLAVERILGLRPLSLFDALATPMSGAFASGLLMASRPQSPERPAHLGVGGLGAAVGTDDALLVPRGMRFGVSAGPG